MTPRHDEHLVPLSEAQSLVVAACRPLVPITVPLDDAAGLVLAEDVVASVAVPPFANTAMDGFAVRAADTVTAPVELDVVATLAAGAAPTLAVGGGQAIRIMTGASIPPGADAVVMVERTEPLDGGRRVRVMIPAAPGDHVRPAGEDVLPGQVVCSRGEVLNAGRLGVLASVGTVSVTVVPRAKVGVLSTGDELLDGGVALGPGQIHDSNRHTLLALARQAGCDAVDLGIVPDDEERLTSVVATAAGDCDALLTSGGVSVGDFDYVKVVLDRLSEDTMRWLQIAIKPAKPFAFGMVRGVPVFGLPGNPASSMVSFELLARPGLRTLMGHADDGRVRVRAVADEPLRRRPDGKLHLVRVVALPSDEDGRFHIRSAGGQASNLLRSMAAANALASVPDGEGIETGGLVDVMLLG